MIVCGGMFWRTVTFLMVIWEGVDSLQVRRNRGNRDNIIGEAAEIFIVLAAMRR